MTDFADFEISLRRRDGSTYSIETRYTPSGSDADIRSDKPMSATFDLETLHVMIADPVEYGKMLAESLFADQNFKSAFADARKGAQTQQVPLRVRLVVGLSAPELNTVYWESLRDSDDKSPLFTNENILFSRYLGSSDWRPVKLRPQGTLRALVAVSNPSNLENYKLAAVDVPGEVARAKETFGIVPVTALGDDENCTLNVIMKKLREGYDILYLAAHGTVVPNKELGINEPRIWLQAEDGTASITPASEIITRMKELQQQPRLVVLASCQSAGKGNGDVLQAIGPQLAQAGIPAVIAMQGNISMDSVKKFMPIFFDELQKDGQIDRALTVARGTIREAHDFWMPVLFMRLKSGKIWYVPGVGDEGEFEKWAAILNGINAKTCTPILGPALYEPFIGLWRDLAARMADEYGFPLSSHFYLLAGCNVTRFGILYSTCISFPGPRLPGIYAFVPASLAGEVRRDDRLPDDAFLPAHCVRGMGGVDVFQAAACVWHDSPAAGELSALLAGRAFPVWGCVAQMVRAGHSGIGMGEETARPAQYLDLKTPETTRSIA